MRKILCMCALVMAFVSNAQEVTVSVSKKFSFKDEGDVYKIGNAYYRSEIESGPMQFAFTAKLKKNGHGITLHKYDEEMKETKKSELEDGKKVFGPIPSKFLAFNDKLLLFFYKYQEDDNVKLYLTEIDKETLAMKNPKEVTGYYQKNVGLLQMKKLEEALNTKFLYAFSPDKTKMVVATKGVSNELLTFIIDKDLSISKEQTSKLPEGQDISFSSLFIDQSDNKYFRYKSQIGKSATTGVFIQNNMGKEKFIEFGRLGFQFVNSKDNSKVYLFGSYDASVNLGKRLSDGIFLATADAANLKLSKETLFPYPDDFKQKIYKLDFGDRSKGEYYVRTVDYDFVELANGTIAMAGTSSYEESFSASNGASYSKGYTGPVVTALITGGKAKFIILPRDMAYSAGSGCIITGYKNNLVCIYNDYEKNLKYELPTDKVYGSKSLEAMVLVSTVIGSDGSIVSRKKISEDPEGKNYFNTTFTQKLADNKYLIPIGRTKVNMVRYYSEIEQWGVIEIK